MTMGYEYFAITKMVADVYLLTEKVIFKRCIQIRAPEAQEQEQGDVQTLGHGVRCTERQLSRCVPDFQRSKVRVHRGLFIPWSSSSWPYAPIRFSQAFYDIPVLY